MGWYVHLHVCFACDTNEGVAGLAKKHLPSVSDDSDGERAARWFLEALSTRTGNNPGPKGGLSLWGIVGNYTKAETFCEALRPFWMDLLNGVDGGPLDFERVLVFEEQEQSDAANAYEIGWDEPDSKTRKLLPPASRRDRHSPPYRWAVSAPLRAGVFMAGGQSPRLKRGSDAADCRTGAEAGQVGGLHGLLAAAHCQLGLAASWGLNWRNTRDQIIELLLSASGGRRNRQKLVV